MSRSICSRCLCLTYVFAFFATVSHAQVTVDREVHAVGINEGSIRTGEEIHGGRAYVTVDRPNKAITLFLSAYEPVTWFVSVEPDTVLEQVFLGGYERQAAAGLPNATIVNEMFCFGQTSNPCFRTGYQINTPQFRNAVRTLHEITGLELSSFQGTYQYNSLFVVDSVKDDPALLSDYPHGTSTSELPQVVFDALDFSSREPLYRSFDLNGPVAGTFVRLPGSMRHLAMDAARDDYYGVAGHSVIDIDVEHGTTRVMDLGLNVPRLSWPVGLTFDPVRDRLLLASLGGEGFLYSYAPTNDEWSVLASMNNVDISSLVYHPTDDSLYALVQNYGESVRAHLNQYSPAGELLRKIALREPLLPGSLDRKANAQLLTAGDYLVILKQSSKADPFDRTYLVDPHTGRVWLAVPEPVGWAMMIFGCAAISAIRRHRRLAESRVDVLP